MTALVASLWLAMEVQGAGRCPAPDEVEAMLSPLLPPELASGAGDRAVIVEAGDGSLEISLARPDGRLVAQRRFPRSASCSEQAETVAVALAVWEAQIHPEISLRLDRLASSRPAVTPPAAGRDVSLAVARTEKPATVYALAVGGGAVASWLPGSVAPGGRLDATLRAVPRLWRGRLSLAGLGEHTSSDVPPGQARWRRLYLALGIDAVTPVGQRFELALGAAVVGGVASIEGSGYNINHAARTADLGIEAMLRVGLQLGAVRPWLGVAAVTWLREQKLAVTGVSTSLALPWAEPLVAVGAEFCWQR